MWHPQYRCQRINRDLVLSGKVDDPLWQTAEAVVLTDPITGDPKRYQTTARLLYNAQYLYIGFQCEDEYVWGTYTERDSPIFTEECVEAFICPSGKVRQYYEINVSPRNTIFDTFILNGKENGGEHQMISLMEYTCPGLLTAIHIDGELGVPGARGWSVEYALPFRSLIGHDHLIPEPGDEWRLNLYRIDSLQRDKLDLYAWATVGKNDFHRPEYFGTLLFQ